MKTELQHFGALEEEDRDILRKHFLEIGANSNWYATLSDAIRYSLDWENIKPDSTEYFYFSNLLLEAEESEKQTQ